MKVIVLDSEGVGLGGKATKLHNLCTTQDGENFFYTTDHDEMREELLSADLLVCHHIIGHDVPAFKAVLGIDIPYSKCWDTLGLSWYLFPNRPKHGLEALGKEHGYQKVKVESHQWEEGDPELMRARVIEDVKINWAEFVKQRNRLEEIYTSKEDTLRFTRYVSFKMDCLREQNENPLKVDRQKAQEFHDTLEVEVETKKAELAEAMPMIVINHERPTRYRKKDGTLSVAGKKWDELCEEFCQPEGCLKFNEYLKGNPNSDPQLKEWLFSLGWEPCTYKFAKNKTTGEEKQIPQVRYFSNNDPRKGELTESIKALMEKEPALAALDGLTMAKHRLSIFANLLKFSDEDGYCPAGAGGFTNTMRLQHRNPFVNLPKADGEVPWGVEIRSCIIAPEGYEMCGSDVVSLEDTTKRHYMQPHDPAYVGEMQSGSFDPHMKLLVIAGKITEEDYEFYVKYKTNAG